MRTSRWTGIISKQVMCTVKFKFKILHVQKCPSRSSHLGNFEVRWAKSYRSGSSVSKREGCCLGGCFKRQSWEAVLKVDSRLRSFPCLLIVPPTTPSSAFLSEKRFCSSVFRRPALDITTKNRKLYLAYSPTIRPYPPPIGPTDFL
jgi:hypothetical protein